MDGRVEPARHASPSSSHTDNHSFTSFSYTDSSIDDTSVLNNAPTSATTRPGLQLHYGFPAPPSLPKASSTVTATPPLPSLLERVDEATSAHLVDLLKILAPLYERGPGYARHIIDLFSLQDYQFSTALLTASEDEYRRRTSRDSGYSSHRSSAASSQWYDTLPSFDTSRNHSTELTSVAENDLQPATTAVYLSDTQQDVPQSHDNAQPSVFNMPDQIATDTSPLPAQTKAKMFNFVCLEPPCEYTGERLCDYTTFRWDYYVKHTLKTHKDPWGVGRRAVCCFEECNMICFVDRKEYLRHMEGHRGDPRSDSSRATRVVIGLLSHVANDLQIAGTPLPVRWDEPALKKLLCAGRLTWTPKADGIASLKALQRPFGPETLRHFEVCLEDLSLPTPGLRLGAARNSISLDNYQPLRRAPSPSERERNPQTRTRTSYGQSTIESGTPPMPRLDSTTQPLGYSSIRTPHQSSNTPANMTTSPSYPLSMGGPQTATSEIAHHQEAREMPAAFVRTNDNAVEIADTSRWNIPDDQTPNGAMDYTAQQDDILDSYFQEPPGGEFRTLQPPILDNAPFSQPENDASLTTDTVTTLTALANLISVTTVFLQTKTGHFRTVD